MQEKINEEKTTENIDTIFNKTLQNTSSVLILSLISKILNIFCNVILVRHISITKKYTKEMIIT